MMSRRLLLASGLTAPLSLHAEPGTTMLSACWLSAAPPAIGSLLDVGVKGDGVVFPAAEG